MSPERSDKRDPCDDAIITGAGFGLITIPPIEITGGVGAKRNTTSWKDTTAPSTGLGGVAESVARTITGRKFWPTVEAWFPPDKASSLSDEAGTATAKKLWQVGWSAPIADSNTMLVRVLR